MVDRAGAGQADHQGHGASGASRANGQTSIWSTDGVPVRERFSYWRDVVCNAGVGFFGTPTATPPGVFSARVSLRSCGPFRFMAGEAKPSYQLALTRRQIGNNPADHYALYLQLSGEAVSIADEEAIRVQAGEIGFCAGRPYRGEQGGKYAIAMVPRAMIDRRAPWLRGAPRLKLAATARSHQAPHDGADQ
jgi:hypothetical protein